MGNCFTNQCSPKPSSVVPVNQDKRTKGRVSGVLQLGQNSAVTIRAITESRGGILEGLDKQDKIPHQCQNDGDATSANVSVVIRESLAERESDTYDEVESTVEWYCSIQ